MMYDTVPPIQTSIVAAQSLVSGTTFGYICLGLGCVSPVIYAAYHHLPSKKLARLEDAIKAAEELLKRAKADCARDRLELMDVESRLLQAKWLASEIQSQMLEAGGLSTLFESNAVIARDLSARISACYGSLKKYLQGVRGITKSIGKCRKEVERIHTATLVIIQAERRRKLSEDIKEARVVTAVLRSPTHTEPKFHTVFSQSDGIYRSWARCQPSHPVQRQFVPGVLYRVAPRRASSTVKKLLSLL
ncbi:hypothetical protein C8R44DRAFT_152032 [Mycena epipterygia]|nr:hypothetical protein C8R44DRAFT_152032 [Mycena epipterygia]